MERRRIQKFIEILKDEARKSSMIHKHSACVIKDNKILAIGYNYSLSKNIGNKYSIHAEVSALLNLPKVYRNKKESYDLIVIRVSNDEVRLSKPCKNCQNFISKFNIKTVYYS